MCVTDGHRLPSTASRDLPVSLPRTPTSSCGLPFPGPHIGETCWHCFLAAHWRPTSGCSASCHEK